MNEKLLRYADLMRYALILAGGSGTRLWPLSRRSAPKQVRALLDDETLLQKTYRRIREQFPSNAMFCSTLAEQSALVRAELSELTDDHFFVEPIARDTAAAIGYAALRLVERDPDAVFVTINADAYIRDADTYRAAIDAAFLEVETHDPDAALVGVPPSYAETGYGYIEVSGEPLPAHAAIRTREDGFLGETRPVARFVEKPNLETAVAYVAGGRHLWNPALFVFRAARLLEHYAVHLPTHDRLLRSLIGITDPHAIARVFLAMPRTSIDYGIMERLERLVVVPASFGWADVGHWRAVHDILHGMTGAPTDVTRGTHVGLGGKGNLVVAPDGKLVATCGIADCVIIDTPDALLICPRDRAQDVKEIVRELEQRGLTQYL